MRLAAETRHFPDIQQHLLVRVIVTHLDQRPSGIHGDAQFFLQLSAQRGFDRFVGLDLAAGKLPQTTLMLGVGTAGDKDFATAVTNDGGGDVYAFHGFNSSSPAFCHALKAGHW